MKAVFFARPEAWALWLERNHAAASEIWVGFHRKSTGRPSLTWPQSVEEALRFGWIDGVRQATGPDRYRIRFTPRKRRSVWSLVNLRIAEALIASNRMHPAGLAAYQARDPKRSGIYSYERQAAAFTAAQLRTFRADAKAWAFFSAQPPSYRKVATFWVVSAKREETRVSRLATLIADSAAGLRIGPLRR